MDVLHRVTRPHQFTCFGEILLLEYKAITFHAVLLLMKLTVPQKHAGCSVIEELIFHCGGKNNNNNCLREELDVPSWM
jgi:hypothetical protein